MRSPMDREMKIESSRGRSAAELVCDNLGNAYEILHIWLYRYRQREKK